MTIGLLFPSPFVQTSHIWLKALLQMEHLMALGHDVHLWSFSHAERSSLLGERHHCFEVMGSRLGKELALSKMASSIESVRPDILYLRRGFWHPVYGRIMRRVPTVAEINTDDSKEFKLTANVLPRVYGLITARLWNRRCAGFVSVTRELAGRLPQNKPVAVISNGVTYQDSVPKMNSSKPRLLFSGTGGYSWHGIDKFIQLAHLFPNWEFKLVGEIPPAISLPFPPNLQATGKLTPSEADAYANEADIGVGTLAAHRKGLNEACPLKVRKYLAVGLPCILGYEDTDFSEKQWFICQLTNRESNIADNKRKIEEFVNRTFRSRVEWRDIEFASEREKAVRRADFLSGLVRQSAMKN